MMTPQDVPHFHVVRKASTINTTSNCHIFIMLNIFTTFKKIFNHEKNCTFFSIGIMLL